MSSACGCGCGCVCVHVHMSVFSQVSEEAFGVLFNYSLYYSLETGCLTEPTDAPAASELQ